MDACAAGPGTPEEPSQGKKPQHLMALESVGLWALVMLRLVGQAGQAERLHGAGDMFLSQLSDCVAESAVA